MARVFGLPLLLAALAVGGYLFLRQVQSDGPTSPAVTQRVTQADSTVAGANFASADSGPSGVVHGERNLRRRDAPAGNGRGARPGGRHRLLPAGRRRRDAGARGRPSGRAPARPLLSAAANPYRPRRSVEPRARQRELARQVGGRRFDAGCRVGIVLVERLVLEERLGEPVEPVAIGAQELQ